MSDAAPDAASKLRTVLDYLPCEACLATPSPEQELLCSVCRRLDREVAVKFVTRTSVILDRPTPAAAPEPVVIPPAQAAPPAEPAGPPPVEVLLRRRGLGFERRQGNATEVVVEPYEEPAPTAPPVAAAPVEAPKRRGLFGRKQEEPAPPAPPAEEEVEWEDVVSFEGPAEREDLFGYEPETSYAPPAEPEPEPEPEPVTAAVYEREDDFVFRAPEREEPEPAPTVVEEEWMPEEEIPLEPPRGETNPWARPEEEAAPSAPVEEEILESEVVDEEPILESEVVDEDVVESVVVEEEVLEMEVVPDEEPPAETSPADDSDLWRLEAFGKDDREALRGQGIESIGHLSGHDANELAARTGRDPKRLQTWIHVADLAHEAGIPIDHAKTLVAAGVAGPRGLAEADAAELAKRLQGADITEREIKRWKRRV